MAIIFPGKLPPGALVQDGSPKTATGGVFAEIPAPIWLTADVSNFEFSETSPDRIIAWQSSGSVKFKAEAVAANELGTLFLPAPDRLQFTTGTNSGIILPDAIAEAENVTIGLVFHADETEDPRTLMSLQSRGDDNYLFLSGDDGNLRLTQKTGDEELVTPLPNAGTGATLLLCAVEGEHVFMGVNGGPAMTTATAGTPSGMADLFLGCRNARSGLHNKLGRFTLTDVMIWPGKNLLAGPNDPALNAVKALWVSRSANGI